MRGETREQKGNGKQNKSKKNTKGKNRYAVFLLYFNSLVWFVYILQNIGCTIKPACIACLVDEIWTRGRGRCKIFIMVYLWT